MRLALVAHAQHPLAEPYAGGLEVFTTQLVRGLRERGHHVVLYAATGTDPALADELVEIERSPLGLGPRPATVPSAPDPVDRPETRAYLGAAADIVARAGSLDLVANHSLQPTTMALSAAFDAPTVTSLHTPPLEPLVHAAHLTDHRHVLTAVSAATAAQWADLPSRPVVIRNGVDTDVFTPGPGGERAVWFGRLRPDKGADLAVAGALAAGLGLDLVGPVHDPAWFAEVVEPLLGDQVRHLGPLDHEATARVVGSSAVALVTPRWQEPFGLVAAEAAACGTPVVALDRGALAEVVGPCGVVVAPGAGARGLADGIGRALVLDRRAVAADARARHGLTRMIEEYERLYLSVAGS